MPGGSTAANAAPGRRTADGGPDQHVRAAVSKAARGRNPGFGTGPFEYAASAGAARQADQRAVAEPGSRRRALPNAT